MVDNVEVGAADADATVAAPVDGGKVSVDDDTGVITTGVANTLDTVCGSVDSDSPVRVSSPSSASSSFTKLGFCT